MTTGSCFCGAVKIEYDGEPEKNILCHCKDCKKISGGTGSINFIIDHKNFRTVSGNPKEIPTTADSGKQITNVFCPDCGTTLYRWGEAFGGKQGKMVLKAGVLDDASIVNKSTPGGELYVASRPDWMPSVSGASQAKAMS